MNETECEPNVCPYCADEDVEHLGKTDDGAHVIHCRECDQDLLVKDVTGKFKIHVEVEA